MPCASPSAIGGSTISLGAGSFSIATYGEGTRVSLAFWADALAANNVHAPMRANVFAMLGMIVLRAGLVCLQVSKYSRPRGTSISAAHHARTPGFHIDLRTALKPARSSAEKSCGCSQAAKCPPLFSLL